MDWGGGGLQTMKAVSEKKINKKNNGKKLQMWSDHCVGHLKVVVNLTHEI